MVSKGNTQHVIKFPEVKLHHQQHTKYDLGQIMTIFNIFHDIYRILQKRFTFEDKIFPLHLPIFVWLKNVEHGNH